MSIASALQDLDDTTVAEDDAAPQATNKKGKGRPAVHDFSGRRTLLKKEENSALTDPEKFAVEMEKAHSLQASRRRLLIDYGRYEEVPTWVEMKLSGPVEVILNLVGTYQDKYGKENVEIRGMEKEPIITNAADELFESPKTVSTSKGLKCTYLECHPHKLTCKLQIKSQAFYGTNS